MKVSNSSTALPLWHKVSELAALSRMYLQAVFYPHNYCAGILAEFAAYNDLLLRYSQIPLEKAKVFEIGFGARPYRLMTLMSFGVDAAGVDLDMPVWRGTPSEFIRMYQKNGAERVVKSLVRFVFFDLLERRRLRGSLKQHGKDLVLHTDRLLVDDAAALELPERSLDLIFSVDVFEHIPRPSLETLIPKMAQWLNPCGLALIRVGVYTGIIGGHLTEWFPHTLKDPTIRRKSEPWEHLRKERYLANTYLNQLARTDYRQLFGASFHILEERVADPDMGREFLTPEVRDELREYPEEELFSNLVTFVLRPKK